MNPYASSSPRSTVAPLDDASPTRVRYGVLAFGVSMSLLLYLDRFAISIAQVPMSVELQLTPEQMGVVHGMFFYVYALAQVPAGWLALRWGARRTLGLYVFIWSVAFGAMGLATGFGALLAFRALLGLSQAGAYPCVAAVLKQWFPVSRRGFANSFTAMGGRSGYLLSTILTPQLMVWVGVVWGISTGQWRWVFLLYGLLGIVWSAAFWIWYRNSPAEHAGCNPAEQRLISGPTPGIDADVDAGGVVQAVVVSRRRSLAAAMLASPTVWLMSCINIFVNVGWIFLMTWQAAFMARTLELQYGEIDLLLVGRLAAAPGLSSMAGGLLGGLATDRFVGLWGLKWGRRITGIVAHGGAAIAYLGCLAVDHWAAYACLFVTAGFLIDFGLGSMWAVYQDIGGKQVSAVLGFANMCGNLAAGVFASVIGYFASQHDWSSVFGISSAALLATMVCWFFVNPEAKLTEDP